MKKILFKIGKFFDKYLGWHKCNKEEFDGVSYIGHCKYCGVRCLQDSQGNWFNPEEYRSK